MDCRASVTITGSLLNCEDVDVKITKIEAAKEAESISSFGITCMQEDAFCERGEKPIGRICLNHYIRNLRERISAISTRWQVVEQRNGSSDSGWRSRHGANLLGQLE
jgi:hypothetical protein